MHTHAYTGTNKGNATAKNATTTAAANIGTNELMEEKQRDGSMHASERMHPCMRMDAFVAYVELRVDVSTAELQLGAEVLQAEQRAVERVARELERQRVHARARGVRHRLQRDLRGGRTHACMRMQE